MHRDSVHGTDYPELCCRHRTYQCIKRARCNDSDVPRVPGDSPKPGCTHNLVHHGEHHLFYHHREAQ